MNRRGFLQLLGAGAAGMVLDPERLLWVPGQKTIVDMGAIVRPNTLLTVDMIVRETLRVLERNLVFSRTVNREYDADFVNRVRVLWR